MSEQQAISEKHSWWDPRPCKGMVKTTFCPPTETKFKAHHFFGLWGSNLGYNYFTETLKLTYLICTLVSQYYRCKWLYYILFLNNSRCGLNLLTSALLELQVKMFDWSLLGKGNRLVLLYKRKRFIVIAHHLPLYNTNCANSFQPFNSLCVCCFSKTN